MDRTHGRDLQTNECQSAGQGEYQHGSRNGEADHGESELPYLVQRCE
jgi:hypothetical protein